MPRCCRGPPHPLARDVPYGFHHFPLPGAPAGFPVWLDINLSEEGASTWLAWLRDALLLDGATRGLAARFVTFNADLGVFASVRVEFDFGAGGSIQVRRGQAATVAMLRGGGEQS